MGNSQVIVTDATPQSRVIETIQSACQKYIPQQVHSKEVFTLEKMDANAFQSVKEVPPPLEPTINLPAQPPRKSLELGFNANKAGKLEPIRGRRSRHIETINTDKQNSNHSLHPNRDATKEQNNSLMEQVEVADLRDSEGANFAQVKEVRIKKMRVSKNTLTPMPGAYF